jgi:hypothetical protein
MLLAELSAYDPPILIASVLGCLMFLVMLANAAMDFWRNIKDKPTGAEVLERARTEFQPKGEYQPRGDFISRQEFAQFRAGLAEELNKLSLENERILVAGGQRERHLASLIEALDGRIDGLPDKLVERFTATIELFKKLKGNAL